MSFIREWVITIVSIIIFITFVEILIPNSNHKRFINVVIGFLLMIVILTPLTKLIKGEINLEEKILKTSNDLELLTVENRINNTEYSNKEAIIKLYKNEITKQIKEHIEYNTEYIAQKVLMEVEDDSDSPQFGLIKSFNITLEEKTKEEKPASKIIKPVEINISIGEKNDNTVEAASILINKEDDLIKQDISDLYKVSKDDINIYLLKNN